MFNINPDGNGYSFTGGGLVILFEGIIFIVVMVTKII